MTERNVVLTEELDAFVSSMVEGGFYVDASDVVREALRKMELENQAKFMVVRAAIEEGFASGVFEGDAFASVREELGLPPRS